jgi:hypothetical protein
MIMHIIEIQYLKVYSNKTKDTDMHDLSTIYKKVRQTIKFVTKDYFDADGNHRFYPNPPVMSDLDVISLTIAAESVQITSENYLWAKLKKDYPAMFPYLIHRASYNRRKKALREAILVCMDHLAEPLVGEEDVFVIDSMPIPTCRIIREKQSKACRREEFDEVMANKGFNKILGGYFIGYKLHLITTESGVYRDLLFTPGSAHDNNFLKIITDQDEHLSNRQLLGDRGYLGKATQLRLFQDVGIQLDIPFRRNQKDFKRYDKLKKRKRKTIEVIFSQYCDEYGIRINYAKRFNGFEIRIISKIAAKTFKQFWNFIHGNPINQTKHALAA